MKQKTIDYLTWLIEVYHPTVQQGLDIEILQEAKQCIEDLKLISNVTDNVAHKVCSPSIGIKTINRIAKRGEL